ncbi:unnamed protein product, partial [Amoebophrya sp. A120]|eukprot:GSA120T00022250001.1
MSLAAVNIAELHAPEWLKSSLNKLDEDGDGLDREELEEMLQRLAEMKLAVKNNSADLDYNSFPEKVKTVLKLWDPENTGAVSVSELALAAEAEKRLRWEGIFLRQILYLTFVVIVLMAAVSFISGLLANEYTKNFKPVFLADDGKTSTESTGFIRERRRLLESSRSAAAGGESGSAAVVGGSSVSVEYESADEEPQKFSVEHFKRRQLQAVKAKTTEITNTKMATGELEDVNNGGRIQLAQAIRTCQGYEELLNCVYDMTEHELQNVQSFLIPTLQGPVTLKEIVSVKKQMDMFGNYFVSGVGHLGQGNSLPS